MWLIQIIDVTALQQKSLLKTKKSFTKKHNEGAEKERMVF